MNHPYFQSENAKERYENLLQNAESFRRVKNLKRENIRLKTSIRSIVGNTLIALGVRSSVDARTNA